MQPLTKHTNQIPNEKMIFKEWQIPSEEDLDEISLISKINKELRVYEQRNKSKKTILSKK